MKEQMEIPEEREKNEENGGRSVGGIYKRRRTKRQKELRREAREKYD